MKLFWVCALVLIALVEPVWPATCLYVANRRDSTLSVVDTTTRLTQARIDVGPAPAFPVVHPNGERVYVTSEFPGQFNGQGGFFVAVIDTRINMAVAYARAAAGSKAAVLNPDGSFLYVSNSLDDSVSVIDTATNEAKTVIGVGRRPGRLDVTPDGAFVYVTNANDNTVSVIDTQRQAVIDTIPVGVAPMALTFTPVGGLAYVANAGDHSISVIDTTTRAVKRTIVLDYGDFVAIRLSQDARFAYIASQENNFVLVLDTTTDMVVDSIMVGNGPADLAFDPSGQTLYVSNFFSDSVSVIDTATNQVVATIPVGPSPDGVALGTVQATCGGMPASPTPTAAGDTPTPTASLLVPTRTATPTLRASATPTRSPTPSMGPVRLPYWESLIPMPEARQAAGAALLRGRVYVVGGSGSRGEVLDSVESYDPILNNWFAAASLPQALHHVAVAVAGDRLYAIGGLSGSGATAVRAVYAYDADADHWERRADLPTARGAAAAVVIGSQIYVVGGQRDGRAVADLATYDVDTDTWTGLTAMPTARQQLVAGAIDNILYAVGGRDAHPLDVLEAYDPRQNTWRDDLPNLPSPRADFAGAVYDGALVVFGGAPSSAAAQVLGETQSYAPQSNRWQQLPDMLTNRQGAAAVVVGGKIIVPGGATGQNGNASAANHAMVMSLLQRPAACAGDCNADAMVSADEIDSTIHAIFDAPHAGSCGVDSLLTGRVSAADLVAALRNVGQSCPLVCSAGVEMCNLAEAAGLNDRRAYGRGAAFVDVDGDGWDDIWASDTDDRLVPGYGTSRLYHNLGHARFSPVDIGVDAGDLYLAWGQAFGDFDNDGDPDLLLANGGYSGNSNLALYRNDLRQLGRFTKVSAQAGLSPALRPWWGVSWADYDNDGWLDFAATQLDGRPLIYHNRGDGHFDEVAAALGVNAVLIEGKDPVWFDYDLDGDQDLYIPSMYQHHLYRNDGAAGFTEVTQNLISQYGPELYSLVFSAAAADFNQDGLPDLYLGRWSTQDLVMINQGDGTFVAFADNVGLGMRNDPDPGENTMGLGVGDLNDDGFPDVLIGTGSPRRADVDIIFCNDGIVGDPMHPVQFHRCSDPVISGHGLTRTHGIILGDPDHDGDTDVFYSLGGHPKGGLGGVNPDGIEQRQFNALYIRQPALRANTTTIHLVGTRSNRDAIGARIEVHGSATHFYTVHSAQGFQSQNSAWLLLNLGDTTTGTATITWPSGTVHEVSLTAGQRIEIVEGEP